jgi:hypothetical protein
VKSARAKKAGAPLVLLTLPLQLGLSLPPSRKNRSTGLASRRMGRLHVRSNGDAGQHPVENDEVGRASVNFPKASSLRSKLSTR